MNAPKRMLVFRNESTMKGHVCIFQSHPDVDELALLTLAWLSKPAFPTTEVTFEWEETYSMIWSESGCLEAGATFTARQVWEADLRNANQVTLTYQQQAFTFRDQAAGPREGSLFVTMDRTIPLGRASVGFGMAGKAICATPALPNADVMFTPKPRYWVAFGRYKQGQVMDLSVMTKLVEVDFHDTSAKAVTLTRDNMWKVEGATPSV